MSSETQVRDSIDHLFRQSAGQMVSILARKFGVANIELIEDSVQDAMIAAMKSWPYAGIPEKQFAWLMRTAANRVIDSLRRDSRSDPIDAGDIDLASDDIDDYRFEGELNEDQIRMMFACCHPGVPADSRVALTLKIVGGFSVGEIATAYLAKNEAIAKLLTRAKRKLRTLDLEIPAGTQLDVRLDSVMRVLYLIFNEGYSASHGTYLIRRDLCLEAIRLNRILLEHPITGLPRVRAQAALFHFQAARLPTRVDADGDLLLLADQDRSKWDREMLAAGLDHLRRAASGDELSDYHLEAEIASLHSLAADYGSTDWRRILDRYDLLLKRTFSPVVALNRIAAVGEIYGPDRAIEELRDLGLNYLMTSFNLYHITRGHFLTMAGRIDDAIVAYNRALELTQNESVLRFIRRKLAMLTSNE